MKEIELTKGKVALVDDEDFEILNQWNWFAHKGWQTFYAHRQGSRTNGKQKIICMHRVILNLKCGDKKVVDHINGNGLDNRKENLRIVSGAQNSMNSFLRKDSKTGYKGVCWHKNSKKWIACIRTQKRLIHLGYYLTKEKAAKAYNEAAIKYHGEFAKLNSL